MEASESPEDAPATVAEAPGEAEDEAALALAWPDEPATATGDRAACVPGEAPRRARAVARGGGGHFMSFMAARSKTEGGRFGVGLRDGWCGARGGVGRGEREQ